MSAFIDSCIEEYRRNHHHLSAWCESVRRFFEQHPTIARGSDPVVHSIRSRMKDEEHLRDKLRRKEEKGIVFHPSDLLAQITDLAGLRVLHLYQAQFDRIHAVIREQIDRRDWCLREDPVAYTWDPECTEFFKTLGLTPVLKDSHYTSIHYVIKPRADSALSCELQVRTLFEEAWGEIDHGINYPHKTDIATCREQLRVLAKLVGASTRLADSIFRAHRDLPANDVTAADPAPEQGNARTGT